MSRIIWQVEHFEEIDSTNTFLSQRVHGAASEGLVVMADFQHSGRGRLDRSWLAPPRSSLLCSILLRPTLDVERLQLVVVAVALALRAALVRISGVRPQLKWPNDLVVGENKIAGILAEVAETEIGFAVVVGFGVNLTYPGPPGATTTTSVLIESGVTIEPRALLDIVLEELETRREQLDDERGRGVLRSEYLSALITIGQRVRIETPHGSVDGWARGVDDVGRLLVDVGGTVETFAAGDVIHLRSSQGPES